MSNAANTMSNKVRTLRWPLVLAIGKDWLPWQRWLQYSGGVKDRLDLREWWRKKWDSKYREYVEVGSSREVWR